MVMDLESGMKKLEVRVTETEQSCEFSSAGLDKNNQELKVAKDEIKKLKKSCEKIEQQNIELNEQKEVMNDKLLDLEFRDMKQNLMFYGIAETAPGNSEDCYKLTKDIIRDQIDIQDPILFDNAHRVGEKPHGGKPRPIVVKFHYYRERERIRQSSFDKSKELKAAGYGIGAQIPKGMRDARKPLYGAMKDAKDAKKKVKFIGKKLFIDGKEYRPPSSGPK